MSQDIVVHRGETDIPGPANTAIATIALTDASKAFVRLVSNHDKVVAPPTGTAAAVVPLQATAFATILSNTQLRIECFTNVVVAKRFYWEIWEYVGPPGGGNEFIVRFPQLQGVFVGIGSATNITAQVDFWRDTVAFSQGTDWGASGGFQQAAQRYQTRVDTAFGAVFFRWVRGINSNFEQPIATCAVVEFTGANWVSAYIQQQNLIPVGVVTDYAFTSGSVGDWDSAFFKITRSGQLNTVEDAGFVAFPGTTPSRVKVWYPNNSGTNVWNEFSVEAIGNTNGMVVQHLNSLEGGQPNHPAGPTPQTINTPINDPVTDLTEAGLIINQGLAFGSTKFFQGDQISAKLQADGGGGFEIEWFTARGELEMEWSAQVINFRTPVVSVSLPLLTTELLTTLGATLSVIKGLAFDSNLQLTQDPGNTVAVRELAAGTLPTELTATLDVDRVAVATAALALDLDLVALANAVKGAQLNAELDLSQLAPAERIRLAGLNGTLDLTATQVNILRIRQFVVNGQIMVTLVAVIELRDFAEVALEITLPGPVQQVEKVLAQVNTEVCAALLGVPLADTLAVALRTLASLDVPLTVTSVTVQTRQTQGADMPTLNLCPVDVPLCFSRGDNPAFAFRLVDEAGAAIDITGFSYTLTVDPSPAPADNTNNIFSLIGVVPTGTDGIVQFQATQSEMDIVGVFFHDVEETNDNGAKRTVISGQFEVRQDITK